MASHAYTRARSARVEAMRRDLPALVEAGASNTSIAARYGASVRSVTQAIREMGLCGVRPRGGAARATARAERRAVIAQGAQAKAAERERRLAIVRESETLTGAAALIGISLSGLHHWLRRTAPDMLAERRAAGPLDAMARRLRAAGWTVVPPDVGGEECGDADHLAAAIRAYLDARGLTTAEIAHEWGVPRRTVEGWLAGRRPTHPGLVMAAIRDLDCSLAEADRQLLRARLSGAKEN